MELTKFQVNEWSLAQCYSSPNRSSSQLEDYSKRQTTQDDITHKSNYNTTTTTQLVHIEKFFIYQTLTKIGDNAFLKYITPYPSLWNYHSLRYGCKYCTYKSELIITKTCWNLVQTTTWRSKMRKKFWWTRPR